jgi:hypothetical protein
MPTTGISVPACPSWALQLGLRCAPYSADNPVLSDVGWNTVAEALADFEQAT